MEVYHAMVILNGSNNSNRVVTKLVTVHGSGINLLGSRSIRPRDRSSNRSVDRNDESNRQLTDQSINQSINQSNIHPIYP